MKHEWFNPSKNGYPNLGNYDSCRKCGFVKNTKNENDDNCRGIVKIKLR